ncbi:MAG: hypothetical protein AABY95_05655 [Pseudomonadota bacterium]
MIRKTYAALAAAVVIGVTGCGTKGGWMGADAEKKYDKELEAQRLASINNNDDYYEFHKGGVIYVISDKKDLKNFLAFDEIPKTVTKIGGGPKGERVVFSVTSSEAKAMEKKVGMQGGAQRMFEGTLAGLDKGFFGFVVKGGKYHVFDNWTQLAAYKRSGKMPSGSKTVAKAGPKGAAVVFANSGEELSKKFADATTDKK